MLGSLVMLAVAVLMFIPNPPQLPFSLPMAMLAASAFTAVMVVLEFIDHHSGTSIGLWLTLVALDRVGLRRVRDGRPHRDAVQQLVLVASAGRRRAHCGPPPPRERSYSALTAATRPVTEAFASPKSIEVFGS